MKIPITERLLFMPSYRGKPRVARLYARIRRPPEVAFSRLGRFRLARGDWEILWMEEREIQWACRFPGLVFDIGAHHGFYTIPLARRGRVVAVEPYSLSVAVLQDNLRLNNLMAEVVEAAVADNEGGAELQLASDGPQNNSLSDAIRPTGETVRVATITLDALADLYGTPVLVKLDIERAELLAFQGAKRLLSRGSTVFLFESVRWDSRRDQVHTLLRAAGYRLATLRGNRERPGTDGPMIVARPS